MSETPSADPATPASGADISDNEYLLELGVQSRLKRALGFFTGSLFAVQPAAGCR
jgi:hypothetical protein